MPDPARSAALILAMTWMVHGGLLLLMAALAGPLEAQTRHEHWLETMEMLGAWRLVEPTQRTLALVLAGRGILAAVGVVSLAVGVLAWRRPLAARWPLHVCAGAHLILLPWAAWAAHDAVAGIMPGLMGLIGEVLTVLAAQAGLVVAMVATERLHRQQRASTSPPSG